MSSNSPSSRQVVPTRAVLRVEAMGIRFAAMSWSGSTPVSSAMSGTGTWKVRNGPSGVGSSTAPPRLRHGRQLPSFGDWSTT